MKKGLIFLLSFWLPIVGFSQEAEEETEKEIKHIVTGSFGYSFVPKGAAEGETEAKGFFVPSIGIDYFYRINEKFELGAMVDLELANYIILEKNLSREKALLVVALAVYRVTSHINLLGGAGIEFEKNRNLAIFRVGGEYVFNLKKEWILVPGLFYDYKEGYNTMSVGIAFGREF